MDKINALAKYLEIETSGLKSENHNHYGLSVYSNGHEEYAIGTNEECDDACKANIKDLMWAFNAGFILSECDLPSELEEGIKAAQEKQCEGANEWIFDLVEKLCGFEFFAQAAMNADGRGHFLSGYDGEEIELKHQVSHGKDYVTGYDYFYAYRIN